MKVNLRFFLVCLLIVLFSQTIFSQTQTEQGKVALGVNLGTTRNFGDGLAQPKLGFIGGISGAYRALPFADLGIGLGLGRLSFKGGFSNDIFNVDLFTNLEVISKGQFRPYITLGVGLISYDKFNVANLKFEKETSSTYFGGTGLRYIASPLFDVYLGADYRFTDTDYLDGIVGSANDGYLNIRSGFNYHLGPVASGSDDPQVIASNRAPFEQVGDAGYYQDDYNNSYTYNESQPTGNPTETKNMEEYVKLKSRIDQLTENVDAREKEVAKLQSDLNRRKNRLSSMETMASKKPSVQITRNSSMNSFSDIYEEALTNYYNKNYNEAISLFELLLQQYPKHTLASNCQFWIGQSHFAAERYEAAIAEFYKVLNYKRSLKKDDALLVLGKAYLKTGAGNRAKESFSRLISDYPTSEFVSEAQDYLARL